MPLLDQNNSHMMTNTFSVRLRYNRVTFRLQCDQFKTRCWIMQLSWKCSINLAFNDCVTPANPSNAGLSPDPFVLSTAKITANHKNTLNPAMDKLVMGKPFTQQECAFPSLDQFCMHLAEQLKFLAMSQKGLWLVTSILLLLLWQLLILANLITHGEDTWGAICPSSSHEKAMQTEPCHLQCVTFLQASLNRLISRSPSA